jgi:hypothetical protein
MNYTPYAATHEIRCMSEQLAGSFALHPPTKAGNDAAQRQHRTAINLLVPSMECAPVEAVAFVLDWAREKGLHGLDTALPIEGDPLTAAAYRSNHCVAFTGTVGIDREYVVWARLPYDLFAAWAASQGNALAKELGWADDWDDILANKLT